MLKIQMLAPFGGKWRIGAERGHEIHVSIKCKNLSLKKFIRHNYLFISRLAYFKMFINRTVLISTVKLNVKILLIKFVY